MRQSSATLTIVPPREAAVVGPWRITLAEVVGGANALAALQDANAGNQEPRDGLAYLLVRVECRNEGDTPQIISTADFAAAGPDGVFRRAASVGPPAPMLEATVAAGETAEGWVALLVPGDNADGSDVVVRYDSVTLGGDWTDSLFAVGDGSALIDEQPAEPAAEVGATADAPAGLGDTMWSGGWAVTALESITGQEVFDRAGAGLQALGRADPDVIATWLAVRLRVTNVSEAVRFFSMTALHLTDTDGEIVDDVPALTPPVPDVSGDYLPGATGEGWVAWDTAERSFGLVRVEPEPLAGEPRFFALESIPVAASGGESAEEDPLPVEPGDPVIVTETEVNLRAEPTTESDVVATLDEGAELVITGEPTSADGYRWYPVEVEATGETGFIVQEFIATP